MNAQEFIHSLEQGKLAKWIVFFVVIMVIIARGCFIVIWHFPGLTEGKGMDQAQIAREIASGNGFSTKSITPLAYAMLKNKNKDKPFPLDKTPDIYEAPLNPLVNSFFLLLIKKAWTFGPKDYVYVPDQVIASISVIFLALGIAVNYLTACRIFDVRVARMAMGLMLFCYQLWMFVTTGLPQLLMFFLFSCAAHCMYRAIEQRRKEQPVLGWLCAAVVFFGLLALAHALAIWIFLGALVFSLIYFTPRGMTAAVMLAVFCLVYTPWLARNYKVSGNPFGLGVLSLIGTMDGSEYDRMRSQDTSFTGLGLGALRAQVREEFIQQTGRMYQLIGQIPAAPIFFLTLLYIFKRRESSDMLWCTFTMFLFAFAGMTITGADNANNLYILFIPIMTLYGFAYIMMLWSRLEFNIPLLRSIFVSCIYIISAVPWISNIMNARPTGFPQWPPYAPTGISYLSQITHPDEVIASDMPWAVAWYADRRSLLIPGTMDEFMNFCDWTDLSDSLVGVYLTPITGDKPFISGVIKGDVKDWAPLIMRWVNLTKPEFPFRHVIQLPIDGECVFYCKSDRWSPKAD